MLEFLLWEGFGFGWVGSGWVGLGRVKGGEGFIDVSRTEDVVVQPPCREGHEFAIRLTLVCLGAG